jgi:hypothetical protein
MAEADFLEHHGATLDAPSMMIDAGGPGIIVGGATFGGRRSARLVFGPGEPPAAPHLTRRATVAHHRLVDPFGSLMAMPGRPRSRRARGD